MNLRIVLVVTLACLLQFFSNAGIFVVTSKADNGPGTLRDAMQKAALNGTTVIDTIFFNLADISRSGRTIILDSSLPQLTSNILIDGTSQNGTFFGISNAKVQIQNNLSVQYFKCFSAVQVSGITIYGLYIKGIGATYALDFRQASNIRFGAPGKGNIVTGFSMAFHSELLSYGDSSSNNITFQSNLLGIDEAGDTTNSFTYNYYNFYLRQVKNLAIGGLGVNEGNIMCDGNFGMQIDYTRQDAFGYLRIEGNKIGTDRTGLKRLSTSGNAGLYINGVNDGGDDPLGSTDVDVDFSNNVTSERIIFFKIKNYFTIRGNTFGVGSDKVTNIGNAAALWLGFEFCGKGIIGGPNDNDKNYLAYGNGVGVFQFNSGSITISKNSFFCNTSDGIGDFQWLIQSRPKSFVTINSQSVTQVTGKSLPNATVELFYDDACPGCEGKTYIASITADNNGNWVYSGNNTGGIVATATDTFGGTSQFSSATINTDSVKVIDATCGKSNGSIKKLRIISGTDWYWQDEQGNTIGHDTDLINILPGKYKFVTSLGGNACKTESIFYQVNNVDRPVMDTTLISIIHPSCGLYNGSLKNNSSFNNTYQYKWLNSSNVIVCNDFSVANPFTNLASGNYYLSISLKQDSSCYSQYGPFMLINQSGPSLQTDSVQTGNATCRSNNGFIKNIKYQNAIGNIYITWLDSAGNIIGNSLDLTGITAGKYRLKFKDGSSCDTIITPYFIIRDTGTIAYDTSHRVVKPSSCLGSDGSITGITSTGATSFTWVNASGDVVGNSADISGIPSGTYRLKFNNSFGCETITSPLIVEQFGFQADSVLSSVITDANCDINNGQVIVTRFSNDTALYSFEWIDSIPNTIISHTTSIQNLAPGFYFLQVTDTNGCSKKIFGAFIKQIGKPVFDTHALQIFDDSCNKGTGAIRNLFMKDSLRYYSWSWFNGQQQIANSSNSLLRIHAGNYYATVTDQYNCSVSSESMIVNNKTGSPSAPRASDVYIPRYTPATLSVINPQQGKYDLLKDNLSGTLPLASSTTGVLTSPVIAADTFFYIRYTYGDCQSPLSRVNVKVFDSTIIYIPTAFTPNADGINDKLHFIVHGRVNQFSISIYNRWGGLVFKGQDVNGYWDAKLKGQDLPSGVFVYVINAVDYNNKTIQQRGLITLIR